MFQEIIWSSRDRFDGFQSYRRRLYKSNVQFRQFHAGFVKNNDVTETITKKSDALAKDPAAKSIMDDSSLVTSVNALKKKMLDIVISLCLCDDYLSQFLFRQGPDNILTFLCSGMPERGAGVTSAPIDLCLERQGGKIALSNMSKLVVKLTITPF